MRGIGRGVGGWRERVGVEEWKARKGSEGEGEWREWKWREGFKEGEEWERYV